ncbi:outer membrane protein [Terrihabitans rhizophilus]|uniref:Outer membrane beta-barrel protein n=1 Tax=Terrihabitans rhizophilus TaxID=3092662 RepID=A0ABU4RSN8_9HYPH|nr:outer membrane beta-barrel protein [Terrihabitans sp. PJ23]MDX6807641.1 outer membrane beta-barrel protein [Terrihabitans sp. PJ23]
MARLPLHLLLLGATAIVPFAAHAADVPLPEASLVAVEREAGWSGFYAGTLIGFGWADFDTGSASGDVDGQTAGGLIGHNWQSGRVVYGIEGDLTLHELRGGVDGDAGTPATQVDTLYSARLRARLGYDLGWALPFVAAGGVMNESYIHADADGFDGDNQRLFGWTAGAGVDFKVNLPVVGSLLGPMVLRAEYVYEDFGEEGFDVGPGIEAGQSTHFVRGAVIWRPGEERTATAFAALEGPVDWSGAYAGLMIGYGAMNLETSGLGTSGDIDADGVAGGIYSGRNFAFGHWVVGYEASLLLANFEGSGTQPGAGDVDLRGNIAADARLRLGYSMDRFLPFIAAGAAWTRSEQVATDLDQQRGRVPAELWTVGAGLDYRMTENVSLRGEYVYARSFSSQTTDFGGVDTDQDVDLHEVRFGAAYHFN